MTRTLSSGRTSRRRLVWSEVLDHARQIVDGYDTGVTLRQLFYRLVAAAILPNLQPVYRRLSAVTAQARRDRTFPDLLDRTSRIEQYSFFDGPDAAREYIRDRYRRDRTERQDWSIYLGVEKAGMSEQLADWFTEPFGIPHVALGGFASQTLCDDVRRHIEQQDRPAVLIYAGDLDPSGIAIGEDFVERVGAFDTSSASPCGPSRSPCTGWPRIPTPRSLPRSGAIPEPPRSGAGSGRSCSTR